MVIVTRQAQVTNKLKVWAQFYHLLVKPLDGEEHKTIHELDFRA